jgi:FixJ family two-component response regulator
MRVSLASRGKSSTGGTHPPIVVMTGRPDPAIARSAAFADAPVLEKPFTGRELLDAIERSLRGGSVH